MLRKTVIFLLMIVLLQNTACSSNSKRVLPPSEIDYNGELVKNTPEKLAKATGQIYIDLSDGKITADEAISELRKYASKDSVAEIDKRLDKFKDEITGFKDYMKSNNDRIAEILFAKTVYVNSNETYIERIQVNKNKGERYFFKQDYILENKEWKVSGDNITDPFDLKWSFNKKYIIR